MLLARDASLRQKVELAAGHYGPAAQAQQSTTTPLPVQGEKGGRALRPLPLPKERLIRPADPVPICVKQAVKSVVLSFLVRLAHRAREFAFTPHSLADCIDSRPSPPGS
jgi:hypothetical protein